MSIPLSAHFDLGELTVTRQRGTDGKLLDNQPDAQSLHYLRALAVNILEPIRELWGCPVTVTSGFRSHDVELKVSGKDWGQHRRGQAADIIGPRGFDIVKGYEAVWQSSIPYDQLLLERAGDATWIHVSISPDGDSPRRQAYYSPDNGHSWAVYWPGATKDQPTERIA